ncbi:MAG: lytic transglycosylase [Hyphomicrobiales bacterium]|nr:lytic transglycosylase [Hyphomicrobiales bacterium]
MHSFAALQRAAAFAAALATFGGCAIAQSAETAPAKNVQKSPAAAKSAKPQALAKPQVVIKPQVATKPNFLEMMSVAGKTAAADKPHLAEKPRVVRKPSVVAKAPAADKTAAADGTPDADKPQIVARPRVASKHRVASKPPVAETETVADALVAVDAGVTRFARTHRARRGADAPQGSTANESVKALVSLYAQRHGVPETLAHRIVIRESRYNPAAATRAHFGLMQISLPTARQMGYNGPAQGLLDARANLTYGMPYLANAWLVSGGNEARAQALYSRGYYYDAKRKGLIRNLRHATSAPVLPQDAEALAAVQ